MEHEAVGALHDAHDELEFTSESVLKLFNKTQIGKKLVTGFRLNQVAITDYHHALWPGVAVKLLDPKQGRTKGQSPQQTFWARQLTMPTSMLIAYVAFALGASKRNPSVRCFAADGFATFLVMLASCLGGLCLPHERFGDNARTSLHVDARGEIDSEEFWTFDFFRLHAQASWAKDLASTTKKWITKEPVMARLPLAQVLAFCLDPSHPMALKNEVTSKVYTLLTHLAYVLDDAVPRIRNSVDALPSGTAGKVTCKRRSGNNCTLVEGLANKVWSGEDGVTGPNAVLSDFKPSEGAEGETEASFSESSGNGHFDAFLACAGVQQFPVLMAHVYMDASSVAKRPTELVWLWSPEKQIGGWCPPIVGVSNFALRTDMVNEDRLQQAARCVQLAWAKIQKMLSIPDLQARAMLDV
ncbi:ANKRD50 [Symbiodinium sp. CCMP2592]|nr:ANKRD50 [Symbiodinium sp. CCMP2592]CAE7724642.1 ANKRD50 [Symbiodinium sp. CCMP2592]